MEVVLVLIEVKFRETAGVEVTAHLFVTETEVVLAHGSVKIRHEVYDSWTHTCILATSHHIPYTES